MTARQAVIQPVDRLSQSLAQLDAMLLLIIGEEFKAFSGCTEEIQSNYLWAGQTLASDAKDAFEALCEALFEQRTKVGLAALAAGGPPSARDASTRDVPVHG